MEQTINFNTQNKSFSNHSILLWINLLITWKLQKL